MDKIQKALARLSEKEKHILKEILLKLESGIFLGLDIQKLKNHKDIFRLRKGDLRILYRKKADKIFLLAIERRSEKTYRNF